MNKVIIILLFCVSILKGYTQSDSIRYEEMFLQKYKNPDKEQVIGKNNVYNVEKFDSSLFIWNTKSIYVDVAPDYPTGFMDEIVLLNKEELHDYLKKHFFQNNSNESATKVNCLKIYIVSDMKGKIVEVYFSCKEDINISIVELEKIENEIKNRCRLSYKSIDSSPIQANYLDCVYEVCE
ncbi:hypothetical protein [Parabacteroides faecis]|uniref:hypothetical protein n=1 Tax=Parabacteroides faecis TaxID=1217282 RepID=UPI003520B0ED